MGSDGRWAYEGRTISRHDTTQTDCHPGRDVLGSINEEDPPPPRSCPLRIARQPAPGVAALPAFQRDGGGPGRPGPPAASGVAGDQRLSGTRLLARGRTRGTPPPPAP